MKHLGDYSLGAFIASSISVGIGYFLVRNYGGSLPAIIEYLVALVAYFAYTGIRKQGNKDEYGRSESWSGEEIVVGFFSSIVALWVPVILGFIFGFPGE